MSEFNLDGSEFIELKNLLKVSGLCANGALAKAVIAEGKVLVDGQVETRKSCKIKSGQIVEFKGNRITILG